MHQSHAGHHVLQFASRRPARCLAEAAIRRESQPLGGRMLKTTFHARCHLYHRLNKITLHVNDPDRHILRLGDHGNQLQFGKFATRHFNMHFVHVHFQELWEHWRVSPQTDRVALIVAKTQVRPKSTTTGH